MPVHVVGAGKVPEAALRFLLAAVHAIEFVAQPGQVRVLAWMSNAVHGPGCARGGAQAAVARPTGACRTLGCECSVRAPREQEPTQEATQLCLATRATVLRADWWRVEGCAIRELDHVQTSVCVSVMTRRRQKSELDAQGRTRVQG